MGIIARYKLKGKDISELAEKARGNQPEEDMNTNEVNDKENSEDGEYILTNISLEEALKFFTS